MPVSNNRKSQPSGFEPDQLLMFWLVGGLLLAGFVVFVGARVGFLWAGLVFPAGLGFWDVLLAVFRGDLVWPWQSWVVVIVLLTVLVGSGWFVWWVWRGRVGGVTRIDAAGSVLGVRADVAPIGLAAVRSKASRLGVDERFPGVPIGVTVASGEVLFGSWEDMHVDIWGPRTGKTTSRAVPAILAAPGSVLVTSNKRDVVDATRDIRAECGDVWVFDPQNVAGESPDWWWNPLSYVTDEVKAAKMAAHFASGSRESSSNRSADPFFDGAGRDLLAGLLLAAALDDRPITDVYRWLTRPTDQTPIDIVSAAGYDLIADQLAGVIFAPDKQRGGVYGTAAQMASCLTNRQITDWICCRGDGDDRPQFFPKDFVSGQIGTLYSLSREGGGTAGPLVTSLTAAVAEAAEEHASMCAGGRLEVPLLGVLDEAANVCRWADLPDLYSHFGSRGVILMTILQSWSQGVDVWGESGMKKLWSASNIAVYGGGVKEQEFLDMLSHLIGDYDKNTRSVSTGRGSHSVQHQLSRERILDTADLAAMPLGRAIVFASGARPTLIRTQPWMNGPMAEQVRASIANHDPAARK